MSDTMSDAYCVCEFAGFCSKHVCEKTTRDVEICKGIRISPSDRDTYRNAWDKGTTYAQKQEVRKRKRGRVGTYFSQVIHEQTGIPITSQNGDVCHCKAMASKMDDWGIDGCREHRKEIVDHVLGQDLRDKIQQANLKTRVANMLPIPKVIKTAEINRWLDTAIARAQEEVDEFSSTALSTKGLPSLPPGFAIASPRQLANAMTPSDVECEHRGMMVRSQSCGSCSGSAKAPVYVCNYSENTTGECTIAYRHNSVPSCQSCPLGVLKFNEAYERKVKESKDRADEVKKRIADENKANKSWGRPRNNKQVLEDVRSKPKEPIPFTNAPTKTLLFHLWPRYEWERHADYMAKYAIGYDRKVMGVATDSDTATLEEAKSVFGDSWEYIHVTNDPKLREVKTYRKLFATVDWTNHDSIIVCAHGKGTQDHTSKDDTIHLWTEALYETVVGNINGISEALSDGKRITGSFMRIGKHFGSKYRYHYSGTFYALRPHLVSSGRQPPIRTQWWGTESLPGDLVPARFAHCFCGLDCDDLYKDPEYIRRELMKWRESNGVVSS